MNVGAGIKAALNTSLVLGKKYAPEILTGVGIVGVVTSAVLASRATLKLEPVTDEVKERLDDLKTRENSGQEVVKERTYVYTTGALRIMKLYAPSVTLGAVSIACILGGHGILRRRNVALLAAYRTIEEGFREYRKRVIDELGAEKDQEFLYGTIESTVVDEETGKKKKVRIVDPNGLSSYARIFEETNKNWEKVSEYNLLFLRSQQNYANDRLKARGYLFLNEVYEMLGFDKSQAGQVVGWVVSRDGDNYIDFGIYEERNADAVNTSSRASQIYRLDFNVDGVIIDKIPHFPEM